MITKTSAVSIDHLIYNKNKFMRNRGNTIKGKGKNNFLVMRTLRIYSLNFLCVCVCVCARAHMLSHSVVSGSRTYHTAMLTVIIMLYLHP